MATASFLHLHPQPLQSLEKTCQPKLPARYRPYSPAVPPAARGGKTKLSYESKQRAGYLLQPRACANRPPPGQAAYTPLPKRANPRPSTGQATYQPPVHSPPGQPADPAPQAQGQQAYPSPQPQAPGYYHQGPPVADYPPQDSYHPAAYPPQSYYPQGPPPPHGYYNYHYQGPPPQPPKDWEGFNAGVNTGHVLVQMFREFGVTPADIWWALLNMFS